MGKYNYPKRINYPNKRKSPIHHNVRTHKRLGKTVKAFKRGSGIGNQKSRSRVVGRITDDDDVKIGVHAFTANFTYSDKPGDGESVIVLSDNYADATDEAWEERIDERIPISVEIIDPDIGAALAWAGKRVKSAVKYGTPKLKKATELGAKYAIRATMVTGKTIGRVARAGVGGAKELGRLTAFAAQKELIQSLLKLCYQKDPAKRIAARKSLKSRYPDVYAMCDFSRETQRRTRKVPEVFHLPVRYVG